MFGFHVGLMHQRAGGIFDWFTRPMFARLRLKCMQVLSSARTEQNENTLGSTI